jgi:hypothetical protein
MPLVKPFYRRSYADSAQDRQKRLEIIRALQRNRRLHRSARISSRIMLAFNKQIDEVFSAWDPDETKRWTEIELAVSRLKNMTVEDLKSKTAYQVSNDFVRTANTPLDPTILNFVVQHSEQCENIAFFYRPIWNAIDNVYEQLSL